MKKIPQLTKAEEQVMQILWKIEKGLVKDVLSQLPKPVPAYNTVSTVIRILEKKGFVDHKAYGNTYEYFPIVSKEEYTREHFADFLKNYFDNSFPALTAFFARENELNLSELEDILKMAGKEIQNQKK